MNDTSILRAPGVEELLGEFQVSRHDTNLKGVQRAVGVYGIRTDVRPDSSAALP